MVHKFRVSLNLDVDPGAFDRLGPTSRVSVAGRKR